jgi:hypothetical protein
MPCDLTLVSRGIRLTLLMRPKLCSLLRRKMRVTRRQPPCTYPRLLLNKVLMGREAHIVFLLFGVPEVICLTFDLVRRYPFFCRQIDAVEEQ